MQRFWKKVNKTETCWLWIAETQHGYGIFWFEGGRQKAHRVAWFLTYGAWPNLLHHTCKATECVRPSHMTDVGNQSAHRKLHASQQTHCKRGHLLAGWNLMQRKNGRRACRQCQWLWNAEHPERYKHGDETSTPDAERASSST